MTEEAAAEMTTDKIVVLCPHCKTNQIGTVGEENTCANPKCGQTFTPDAAVPVIVPEPPTKK